MRRRILPRLRILVAVCVLIGLTGCESEPEAIDEQEVELDTPKASLLHDEEKGVILSLSKILGRPAEEISPYQTFARLGIDDVELVEFIMKLEQRYQISIPDEAIEAAAGTKGQHRAVASSLTVTRLVSLIRQARRARE